MVHSTPTLAKAPVGEETSPNRQPHGLQLLCWLALSCVLLGLDAYLSPAIQFPFLAVPVGLAVWYNGMRWGIAFAIVLPLARLLTRLALDVPETLGIALTNYGIRVGALLAFAFLIDLVAKQNTVLAGRIKVLEGLLPICAHCKKIRDESNAWHQMEGYITERSEARFSHGICPECLNKHFGEALKP